MNKNKGIIGIGLILAIVLGIVVVGGGAYYLGKSSSKQEVKNPETVLTNNENQKLLVVENKNIVVPSDWKTYSNTEIGFEFKYPPSVVVDLDPSHGSSSTSLGFRGIVKNSSGIVTNPQNLDDSADVDIKNKTINNNPGVLESIKVDGQDTKVVCDYIDGTCIASILLPNPVSIKGLGDDTYFGILVLPEDYLPHKYVNQILSTFKFTNSGKAKTISTTNWKTYTNAEYGFSFKYPSNWDTPSGSFNGKIFEVYSKESITVPFIDYHPSNNKLTMSDFIGTSWGHDSTDVPTKINVAGQNASKFTYETATNGKGQPYPLFNQQVGFPDNKGGFFVINFAVPPTEKENGINLFNQILSSFILQ